MSVAAHAAQLLAQESSRIPLYKARALRENIHLIDTMTPESYFNCNEFDKFLRRAGQTKSSELSRPAGAIVDGSPSRSIPVFL